MLDYNNNNCLGTHICVLFKEIYICPSEGEEYKYLKPTRKSERDRAHWEWAPAGC